MPDIYQYKVAKHIRSIRNREIWLETVTLYDGADKAEAEKLLLGDSALGFGESLELSVFANIDNQTSLVRHFERNI